VAEHGDHRAAAKRGVPVDGGALDGAKLVGAVPGHALAAGTGHDAVASTLCRASALPAYQILRRARYWAKDLSAIILFIRGVDVGGGRAHVPLDRLGLEACQDLTILRQPVAKAAQPGAVRGERGRLRAASLFGLVGEEPADGLGQCEVGTLHPRVPVRRGMGSCKGASWHVHLSFEVGGRSAPSLRRDLKHRDAPIRREMNIDHRLRAARSALRSPAPHLCRMLRTLGAIT